MCWPAIHQPASLKDSSHVHLACVQMRHCALSLVGEPIMYPKLNAILAGLHQRHISSFLVIFCAKPLVPASSLLHALKLKMHYHCTKANTVAVACSTRKLLQRCKAASRCLPSCFSRVVLCGTAGKWPCIALITVPMHRMECICILRKSRSQWEGSLG